MTSVTKGRLDKLYPSLTAKERALHVLQAWKAGKPEDPRVRSTMPYEQIVEFNRLIGLMNVANSTLAQMVALVEAHTVQISLRLGWLETYETWALLNSRLHGYFVHETPEPITASEYQRLVREERESHMSVTEAAEMLVDRYTGWTDEDRDGEFVEDEAWDRVLREKEKEVRLVAREKEFRSRRGKDGLEVQVGSFHDWLGEEVVPHAHRCLAVRALPGRGGRCGRAKAEVARDLPRDAPPRLGKLWRHAVAGGRPLASVGKR